ncbi:MAG: hypothetical protein ABI675_24870 [Chitinophagaceae bacterium]
MKNVDYHIIPYNEEYNESLVELEKGIIQGKRIQLEIIKDDFFSRAKAFNNTYSCIALTDSHKVIGSAIGAQTMIKVNGQQYEAGFGFDTKVHPEWRSKRIGRMLAKDLYKQFFGPQGLSRNFMTAKLSNAPVLKLVSHAVSNTWLYDFIYLTIPTNTRVKQTVLKGAGQQFSIQLSKREELCKDYYIQLDSGLAYFNTYKMYRLNIQRISWLYKQGISILKSMQPSKYAGLPGEHDTISFASLFNHTSENIRGINEVLENLESNGIKQLLVCCRKNDVIYQFLKNTAINQYSYYLVADFKLNKHDEVGIDVRCL